MPDKKPHTEFHHALKVNEADCIGCTHCMTVCPTRAIRVRNGKARIIANRCVDCGECYKACPVSAIEVEQDDLQMIFRFEARVILIPSILIGQFSHKIPASSIYSALREIGFTHVFQVENTVDMVLDAYSEYRHKNEIRPLISSFCPAIVRLIQVRFPSLADNIIRVNPPIDMSALYYLEQLKASGIPEKNIGLFYATPCAAKIAAIKSPVGDTRSIITGVINMDFLYNKIQKYLQTPSPNAGMPVTDDLLNSRGVLWSLTRGEAVHCEKRALAVDGIRNVTEILENVENDKLGSVEFLELRACDESCAGGILMTGNRFLTVERLKKLSAEHAREEKDQPNKLTDRFINIREHSTLGCIEPRNIEKLDEDMSVAMKKMARKRRMMCFLPGFDCGACGAPDCQTLAEDIVQGRAQISHCVFLQQQLVNQNLLSHEKAFKITGEIWGSERLEKNCNKIGAEDENY
jgi:iron only hydrogenase large subunit-like protein